MDKEKQQELRTYVAGLEEQAKELRFLLAKLEESIRDLNGALQDNKEEF